MLNYSYVKRSSSKNIFLEMLGGTNSELNNEELFVMLAWILHSARLLCLRSHLGLNKNSNLRQS